MTDYAKKIHQAFGFWLDNNLADYGKFASKDKTDLERMAKAWEVTMKAAGVRIETIPTASARIAIEGGDFPDVGKLIRRCQEARSEMFKHVGIDLPDNRMLVREVPANADAEEVRASLRAQAISEGLLTPALPEPEGTKTQDELRQAISERIARLKMKADQLADSEE